MSIKNKEENVIPHYLRYSVGDHLHGKAVKVKDLMDYYLLSDRYLNLSRQSKKSYYSVLNNVEHNLLAHNGKSIVKLWAHNIDHRMVDYFKRSLSKYLTTSSISLYFSVLSAVWEHGRRQGRIEFNPWSKSHITVNNMRDITWETEEIELAIETAKKLGYHVLAYYILMAYETGQRPWSDLRELTWDNIRQDTDGTYLLDFVIAKTNQKIIVPLSAKVIEVLSQMPRVNKYIFVTSKGNRLTSGGLTTQFKKVKAVAGLKDSLKIRDLRRTAVTELAMGGATVSEITAITGWKVSEKVLNRYAVIKLQTAKHAQNKRDAFREQQKQSQNSAIDSTLAIKTKLQLTY